MNSEFAPKDNGHVRRFLATRHGKIITAVLLSLLGSFILFEFVVMPLYTRQGTERLVPNLTAMPAQQARQAADSAGFELVLSQGKVSKRVPEGWILEQHPFAGTMAKPGRKIRATPALPGVQDIAPDLVGLDIRDAQLRCRNVGLVCGPTEVRYRFSGRVPKDGVLEQDPQAGKPVKPGSTVKLVVSMGPEPAHFYVPQIVDETLHDARNLLREAGLILVRIERRETDDYPAGTVIEQSLLAGQEVGPGTEVSVVVAVHPHSGTQQEEIGDLNTQLEELQIRDSIRAQRLRQDSLQTQEQRKQDSIRRIRRRY